MELIKGAENYKIKLSPQETRIAWYLCRSGLSNKEISDIFFTTEKTIKFHVTNIYKKLNKRSRAQVMFGFYNRTLPSYLLTLLDQELAAIEPILEAEFKRLVNHGVIPKRTRFQNKRKTRKVPNPPEGLV